MSTQSKLLERLSNWTEAELDDYSLPHPGLGDLSVREMLFFTVFHTRHHLRQMRALLADTEKS